MTSSKLDERLKRRRLERREPGNRVTRYGPPGSGVYRLKPAPYVARYGGDRYGGS